MFALLQVVTAQPSLVPFFLALVGALQALSLWILGQSSIDRRDMRAAINDLQTQVAKLNAHVGVDGNGIMSRLDDIARVVDEIKTELAEKRGAAIAAAPAAKKRATR